MSGTKASNQQRTTKRAMDLIAKQKMEVQGHPSMYQTGWNAALATVWAALERGDHLHPPKAELPGLARPQEVSAQCGARDADGPPCIHPKGHVEAGQPLHNNGRRTWRTPRT